MGSLDLRRLDVYRAALELLAELDSIAARIPRRRHDLADQLRRAATSIALNIGEGAGEFSGSEKARFYRIARRSAAECMAILDCLEIVEPVIDWRADEARALIGRELEMLTSLAKRCRARPRTPPRATN